MCTLKEKVIDFIVNYFRRLYLTKHKTKSKIRKLRNEIPLNLIKAIEDCAETTNDYHYYRDNEEIYLCFVYTILSLFLIIILFLFLIWVTY